MATSLSDSSDKEEDADIDTDDDEKDAETDEENEEADTDDAEPLSLLGDEARLEQLPPFTFLYAPFLLLVLVWAVVVLALTRLKLALLFRGVMPPDIWLILLS